MIWNAFDADATKVDVLLKDSEFGVSEIVISDNGKGFSKNDASIYFGSLGDSWKAKLQKSEDGRYLHGKEGQGRFKAFSLGRYAEWSIYDTNSFKISGVKENLENFNIESIPSLENNQKKTIVKISELNKNFHILNPENAEEKLLPIFSLYLRTYKNITLTINQKKVDPSGCIEQAKTYQMNSVIHDNVNYDVELEIIEWKHSAEKEVWYCTNNGFPQEKYTKQVRGVGDFGFSAYIKSELISTLSTEGTIGLGELNVSLKSSTDEAIALIKKHFKDKLLEEGREQITQWKSENVYPFDSEAGSPVEVAERQVFDIVAVKLAENMPSINEVDKSARAFQLRMLKHAVENSPEDLQNVISEVLKLPKKQLEEFSGLLQDVSLSSMISASKLVSDRLKFLKGLEFLLFNKEAKKNVKERSQLHKILAKNPWLFGEEFTLSVDDKSLTEVLKKHSQLLKSEVLIDKPVKRVDKTKGIVDLMLSRTLPCSRSGEIDHLVVELKAPKVNIGTDECNQIESYAFAVASDERFASLKATWNFWIISNEMDPVAKRKSSQTDRAKGILHQAEENGVKVTVWAKEWSQIIDENKHRLKFIQEKLNHSIGEQEGFQYLQDVYSEFTQGIVVE